MRRAFLLTAMALTVVFPVVALAASLNGVSARPLAVGTAAVSACDSSFQFGYTTVSGKVTAVSVGDIADPACEAGDLSLTLVDAAGASLASGGPLRLAADGDTSANTVSVSVAPQPAAGLVAGIRVSITGP